MLGYRVRHIGYCGMETFREYFAELQDAKDFAAGKLREYRSNGFPVSMQEKGKQWEIQEPENAVLVPDDAGYLTISRIAATCRECGCEIDTEYSHCEDCAQWL